MTDRPTITDRMTLLADQVGPPDAATAVAERLLYAAHQERDRDVWGGDRALTYWDRLPEKVRGACYAGPTLAAWWERITRTLGSGQPRRAEDRQTVAAAIGCGDDRMVLDILRTRTETVCLRVRLATQIDTHPPTEPAAADTQEAML